jgi:prephenate dehydrogenase
LHYRWNRIAAAYERLWDDMYADNASRQLEALERRTAEASKASTAYPANRRRLEKWQTHVELHHHVRPA